MSGGAQEQGDIRFAGYAAVFDRVDRGGDVVRRGAFGALEGKRAPLLWQHAPDRPVFKASAWIRVLGLGIDLHFRKLLLEAQ